MMRYYLLAKQLLPLLAFARSFVCDMYLWESLCNLLDAVL